MEDLENIHIIFSVLIKVVIIHNAKKLGWIVEINTDDKKIVLTKRSDMLNDIDNDTYQLVNNLLMIEKYYL